MAGTKCPIRPILSSTKECGMFKKTAWLAGAIAACFLSLSAPSAAADDGRKRHGGHGKYERWDGYGKYEKWDRYGKHYGHKRHGHKHSGHKHSGHKHSGHKHSGHKHSGHRHPGKHYGHYRGRHYGYWPYGPQRRSYIYDDGRCRIVIVTGPYGHRQIVRCGPGYPVGRYIPGSLIHTHPPAVLGQVLDRTPDGQGIVWDEPQSGNRYELVPTRSYKEADGRYCREYQSTATLAGQTRQVYGQACRQPDGTWAFVQ
jgi:hypothetical protein